MINSIFPIRDRIYFLKKGKVYQEYRYTERGNSFSGRYIKGSVSIQTNKQMIQHFFRSMTLPYEKNIWDHAPKHIQQAILFSYSYHEHHKNKKVANVEIRNWLTIPYFSNLLTSGYKKASLVRVLPYFRTWFNAMTMTHGNHKKNLRIGHIHFSYDVLDKKEVYCVHWDIGASRFSPTILVHWLLDDMSS